MTKRLARDSRKGDGKLRLGRRQHRAEGCFEPIAGTAGVLGPVEQAAVDMKREARGCVPKLIADEGKADTRKLYSTEAFVNSLASEASSEEASMGQGSQTISLKSFAEQRRAYLLKATAIR